MKNLQLRKKIRDVEEDHAEEILNENLEKHDLEKHVRSLLLIGGIRAADRISQNISSQVINALVNFQEEKMHEQLGYSRFADFLDNAPMSPMPKNEFYRRKELFDAEGAEIYDAFNAMRIPMSTRKLLAKKGDTDIVIEGDEIVIGDERADLSNLPIVKQMLNDVANHHKALNDNQKKQTDKIEDLMQKLEIGSGEYQELRRALDASTEGTPYERALTKSIGALINLTLEAKKLPLIETQNRGRGDIEALWKQMQLVRHALYQEDFVFIDEVNAKKSGISKMAMQVLAKDDDFGDENEG